LGYLHTEATPESITSAFRIESITPFGTMHLHARKLTVLVLDNASWHPSAAFRAPIPVWEEKGLLVFYLPTDSPHLNFAETLWRKTKDEGLPFTDSENEETFRTALHRLFSNYGTQYRINTPLLESIFKGLEVF
jgi:transposase